MAVTQPCAGGIVFDAQRRLLLIKRAHAPAAGTWSLPGGRCLTGEPAEHACVREVAEETGLTVRVLRSAGSITRDGLDGIVYAIEDFVCEATGGRLCAGDDADDVRWATRADLQRIDLAPGLLTVLDEWQLLPD